MTAQPSLQCYTGSWRVHAPFAGAFIIIYSVGIPALFWAILMYHHRRPDGFASSTFIARYSALTLPYLPSKWYYEIINLSRRAAIVLALDLTARSDSISIQVNVVVLIIVSYLVLSLFLAPYHFSWINRLTAVWMVCCSYVSLCALTLSYAQSVAADPNKVFHSSESRLIGSLLVFALAFCVTFSAVVSYMEFRLHRIIKSHKLHSMPLDYAQCDSELSVQSQFLFPSSPFLLEKFQQLNLVRKRAVIDDMSRLLIQSSTTAGSSNCKVDVDTDTPIIHFDMMDSGIEFAPMNSRLQQSLDWLAQS